jgi:hypothetical protein
MLSVLNRQSIFSMDPRFREDDGFGVNGIGERYGLAKLAGTEQHWQRGNRTGGSVFVL